MKSCCALTLKWINVIKPMVEYDIWDIVKLSESVKLISYKKKISIVETYSMSNFEIYKDCLVTKSFTRRKTLMTKRLFFS